MPKNASSALGQQIGALFDDAIVGLLTELSGQLDFELLSPQEGTQLLHLTPAHGIAKQIDHVIVGKGEKDPLVVIELKWLKDGRHIYDKGGWIEGLAKIKQHNPTIRGVMALLAGYWSPRILQQLEFGGHVRAIVVLNVDEMYTLLRQHGVEIQIDRRRNAIANPEDALARMIELSPAARDDIKDAIVAKRRIDIEQALRGFLTPVEELIVTSIEVLLKTNQGNVFAQEFATANEAKDFILKHTGPDASQALRHAVKARQGTYQLLLAQDD